MRNTKAKQVALLGMLFALAMALSFLESMVSPLLGLMPAMKLGLANVVVMFALLYLNGRSALALVALKALFAFLTRGATAGFLSLCGGLLSLLALFALLHGPLRPTAYIFSACGALAHNLGQLLGAAALLSSTMAVAYAPVLLVVSLAVGGLTAVLGTALYPALRRMTPAGEKIQFDPFLNKKKS